MTSKETPSKITSDMTVLDVVSRWRQTEAVFRSYDKMAGECICCNALFETLSDAAARYSLDLSRLISDLAEASGET
ncbi:MAG: hypothetical protein K9K82_11520 [Desulfobacteraceae bacterium]|nr:hypothetical protein [Desulfobacteraceae bacterium]